MLQTKRPKSPKGKKEFEKLQLIWANQVDEFVFFFPKNNR